MKLNSDKEAFAYIAGMAEMLGRFAGSHNLLQSLGMQSKGPEVLTTALNEITQVANSRLTSQPDPDPHVCSACGERLEHIDEAGIRNHVCVQPEQTAARYFGNRGRRSRSLPNS